MALQTAQQTSYSSPPPNSNSSRKRPLDSDLDDENTKKYNFCPGTDGVYHLKILIPSLAAGAIIGKGGDTIAQLQKDTNARIKMSKANDFYPGTTERICLISGSSASILEVLDFITFKIRDKSEVNFKSTTEQTELNKATDRDKQLKILVPNSTAGMIIGKGGSFIKKMKDESGSYVQISQKAKDQTLQERCITVIGDAENNRKACTMILSKIEEDPQSGTCLNISYADVSGPVANFSPTGSPFAQPTVPLSQGPSPTAAIPWTGVVDSSRLPGITLSLNLESHNALSAGAVSHIVSAMTIAINNTAYPDHIKQEITSAIGTLGKYRMLGVTWTAPPHVGVQRLDSGTNGFYGGLSASLTTTRNALDLALEPYRQQSSGSPAVITSNGVLLTTHDGSDKFKDPRKVEVEIPENLVGAVLGEGGRSLTTLQEASGATIQISKKGVFVPGTRNRLATITGNSPAVFIAHSLMYHRIAEEQMKRSRHFN